MKIKLVKKLYLFDYRKTKSFKDFFYCGPEYLDEKIFEKIVDIEWLKEAPEELHIEEEGTFRRFVDLKLSFPVYKGKSVLFRDSYEEQCKTSLDNGWEEIYEF